MDENLKPCPFCGKSEHIKVMEFPTDIADIGVVHIVYCTYCGGQIRNPNREDAVKAWNMRACKKRTVNPCPKCGSKADVARNILTGEYFVFCEKCGHMGGKSIYKKYAIDEWNRRTV